MSEDQQTPVVKKLVHESYLSMVESSLGSTVWQHYYAEIDGERQDIMDGGSNACAWFVSGILIMHGLIKASHATVSSTVKDLKESGWVVIDQPKAGAIIVYEAQKFEDGSTHTHMAISVGDEQAVSTSYTKAVPIKHDWRYRDHEERTVTEILWFPGLEQNRTPFPKEEG